jgi:hypothetical protein
MSLSPFSSASRPSCSSSFYRRSAMDGLPLRHRSRGCPSPHRSITLLLQDSRVLFVGVVVLLGVRPAWAGGKALPAGAPNIYDPAVQVHLQAVGLANLQDNPRPAGGPPTEHQRGPAPGPPARARRPQRERLALATHWMRPSASPAPRRDHPGRGGVLLSRLNTRPARSPVNASPAPLRRPAHDSGTVRVASPSPCETFIHYTLPV